jgi:hypothetical protein
MEEQAATLATSSPNGPKTTPGKKAGGKALSRLMARGTTDETGKGGMMRRRRMKFTMAKELCDPGLFDEDFDIVLVSASTQVELDALKKHTENPAAILFEMAKMCIVSCDGEPVRDGDGSREVLWEALGFGGRSMLTRKWNELCGNGDQEALKKADSSTQLIL